jgi:hypothetical protein
VPTQASAGSGSKSDCESDSDEEAGLMLPEERAEKEVEQFRGLLELLQIGPAPSRYKWEEDEAAVDFSKSVLLTSDAYISMMHEKINLKEVATKEREERRK